MSGGRLFASVDGKCSTAPRPSYLQGRSQPTVHQIVLEVVEQEDQGPIPKEIPEQQIEADLRTWFTPNDAFTDFNPFFQEIARITKERNLVLAPITVMIVTDGLPDVPGLKAGSQAVFHQIDLNSLEYLSRNITVRLAYVNPKIAKEWRTLIPRQRVRLWIVDAEVMKGWTHQLQPGVDEARQERFWKWVQDNVDFHVRSVKL